MGFGNQVDVLVAKPIKQFHVCVVLNVQDYIERKCYKLCNLTIALPIRSMINWLGDFFAIQII
jgi:hypothetical protein